MADAAGTAAAAGGTTEGAAAQTVTATAPSEWAESEHFKPFYKEDKSFDFTALSKSYADTKALIPVVPAKAENYTFEFPKDFPLDEAALKLEKEAAKNLGLTQTQFEGLQKFALSEYARVTGELATKIETAKAAAKAELVREWGGPQKFDANMARVDKAAEQFFGKEAFSQDALRNNPVVIRGLFKIAEKLTESTTITGSGAGAGMDNRPLGIDGRPIIDYSKTTPGPKS